MAKKEAPATTQAEYDKAYEEVKSGKQPVPSFNDMGPVNPGNEMLKGTRAAEEAAKQRAAMQKALLKGATEGMGGKELEKEMNKKKGGMIKKYSKGGTASARADGCAVKGKTKGRIV